MQLNLLFISITGNYLKRGQLIIPYYKVHTKTFKKLKMSAVTMSAEELAKMNVVEEITIPIIQGELDLQSNVAIKQESKQELKVWHYWLWSFKTRDTKLEGFLRKNQRTQRKLLNFESWTNGEPQ